MYIKELADIEFIRRESCREALVTFFKAVKADDALYKELERQEVKTFGDVLKAAGFDGQKIQNLVRAKA